MLVKVKLKDIVCRKKSADIHWSTKQKAMIKQIAEDYNEDISLIWVSKDNAIIDGHHRYTILFNEFGGEHEITVRKFNVSIKNYYRIGLLLLPISITILWPIYVIIEKIKLKKMDKVVTAAGVFFINRENQVLICHPTNHDKNSWSIPKGKVEKAEYSLDAAVRETYEETNIDLSNYIDEFIKLETQFYKHKKKKLHPYVIFEKTCIGLYSTKFDLKCNSNVPEDRGGFPEMDDYKWVSIDEARNLLHPTQVACLDKIVELNEKIK